MLADTFIPKNRFPNICYMWSCFFSHLHSAQINWLCLFHSKHITVDIAECLPMEKLCVITSTNKMAIECFSHLFHFIFMSLQSYIQISK